MSESDLVIKHWRQAMRVANRFAAMQPRYRDDLYSAAGIGLLRAVRNYINGNDVPLPAAVKVCVTGAIIDELRRQTGIRPGRQRKSHMVAHYVSFSDMEFGRDENFQPSAWLPLSHPTPDHEDEFDDFLRRFTLSPDQRDLLRRRFVEDKTLADIAAEDGVDPSRIGQRLRPLLAQIKAQYK